MDVIESNFPKYDDEGKALVRKAYEIAEKALASQTRGNGRPFIEHPLNVAKIAADEIGLPAECIAAVFLHEASRMQPDCDIKSGGNFGQDIYTIVDGLNKISTIKPKDTRLEAELYKKLIVSYSTDPRVTVLKLADRLEVMRSLEIFPKLSRERKILETLMLYIPLAHQLGLYNMKSEMEDIYFRHAEPEQYRAITNKLKATEKDRQALMTQFIEPLKQKLSDAGIKYKLKIRTKTAYSIWRKMQKQKVPFEGVYDVFAIRFIIDCDTDRETEHALCWKVFSYVTEEYEPDTARLRDWISNPKPNGYESLHITVRNSDNVYLEVQIRTARMDEMAENGLASHWSYKGIRHEATLDRWLVSVRNILEHSGSPKDSESEGDTLPKPPSNEIFVFTPTGELRKLPAGATVLDFAFDIHSNLGIKCTGGKVNGKAVPIKEKLATGDIVEIMSGKNQKPSPDWLNFVVTSKARTKIRQKLSEAEFMKAAEGKELLARRMKNWKMELSDEIMAVLMKKFQYKTVNAFYAAIGDGTLDISDMKELISGISSGGPATEAERPQDQTGGDQPKKKTWTAKGSADDILVIDAKNLKNLDYRMSKCCNPVYGDDVFGFVSIKDGIKIHRISCPNAARLMEMYPYRIQKVRWSDNPGTSSFQTSLKVTAAHEPSVINDIIDTVNIFKTSIRSFNVNENGRNGTYEIALKLSVPSNLELDKVISRIRAAKNVIKVSRG
ncbi:MAG: bifunctional (p)ppGpp synthetase/guanosine-3',5'-bis(diphosphate) 3'-pyrophosphohydrolase [Bacteroidetes bacterium]|uniref:Bifunctional (P)ppGpp synthetase/guanosine-3',5'-bis(Diphosphate) 3'-pyrophosphohydrolase n=1 Tax=Candidatus Cryptobacteroides excrementavium TaxID=2840759 RepID=A0A9D9J7M1_9BACT|nr:bifunctional (p)ppGpp synthetase/guanosine-3',5'-bis(diphosphate) 3'-pyrophosphohydrolase [Candidatus Cryptobacteroides excrementavium]